MDNDRLEILMGKFFDGEIEPSEQRLLDAQLDKDPQNRRLFDQYRALHTLAQAEVAPLAEAGRSFESVFDAAWKTSRRGQRRFVRAPLGIVRFVSGMAAGLLLAVLVQFSMRSSLPAETPADPGPTAQAASHSGPDRVLTRAVGNAAAPVIKDVDYYYYTDENGQRWLIEGYRENIRTQLVSYQDM